MTIGSAAAHAQVSVYGQWGSKIEALLRRLVWLRDNEPDIKCLVRNVCRAHEVLNTLVVRARSLLTLLGSLVGLCPLRSCTTHAQVFSQWRDALKLVSKALDVQNPPLPHVSLTGVKRKGQARHTSFLHTATSCNATSNKKFAWAAT